MASTQAEGGGQDRQPREIRLEGASLVAAAAVLCAMLAVAFQAGRWMERSRAAGGRQDLSAAGSPASVEALPYEAAPTVFDTAPEAEPRREADRPEPEAAAAEPAPPPPGEEEGPWTVQVFAGRDRESAQHVFRTVRSLGHRARLETSREGRTVLFRVRVGGFATREAAEQAAERLRREGVSSTWVTAR